MRKSIYAVLFLLFCPLLLAQQAMNNDAIIKLVKAGLSDDLIVSTINGSAGNYDTSADALVALKTAGASDKVLSAVIGKASAQLAVPPPHPTLVAPPDSAPGATPAAVPFVDKVILTEGSDVPLLFDQDISSKTAAEGDPVMFVLGEDLKVGNVTVVKAGCKAMGEVTNAKKAGMMGKAGELNVRVDYLSVGDIKIKLRGVKGKEGESGTTGAIVLTVLFGPIGLIKHGSNIDIKKGTALKVYVADNIGLPPLQ